MMSIVAVETMVFDFRRAVGQDCMGWFCEKYGWGDAEWAATSPLQLVSVIALKIDELRKEVVNASCNVDL